MTNESNIILIDSLRESFKNDQIAEVAQPIDLEAQWQTPGLYLAQRIANNSLVRFVGERVQTDYLQIIVVIDDPVDLLLFLKPSKFQLNSSKDLRQLDF